ncbi:SDR family oxidoreductase [Candidatus Dependentiae bacterium]|nr:SDR family oxidoreductase [Candidatus Dependentiae bacterium]
MKNKVVVITGASSGIGKASAIEFAKQNATVILAARREGKLQELQAYISSFNKNCIYIKTDVTKENEVINLFNETEKLYGRIDILINNAGRGLKSDIINISFDDWLSVIHTNLTSVFLCTRETLKRMIQKKIKGHIITISSIAGLYGVPNYAGYCASKHGVTGFQRSLKWEVLKHGIKVSTIHPGRVDTEFFDIYKKKPSRSQMLSPKDIAIYIIAIASRFLPKIIGIRILNMFKRIYYFLRYILK